MHVFHSNYVSSRKCNCRILRQTYQFLQIITKMRVSVDLAS